MLQILVPEYICGHEKDFFHGRFSLYGRMAKCAF